MSEKKLSVWLVGAAGVIVLGSLAGVSYLLATAPDVLPTEASTPPPLMAARAALAAPEPAPPASPHGSTGMSAPHDQVAASLAAEIQEKLSEPEGPAFQILRNRLQENPADVDALLSMGYLYVTRRDYLKARGYYLQASQEAPENLEARTHLGTVAYFLDNLDEALHHYQSVLALDPDYTVALFEMGAALRYGKEDLPAAIQTWERFLALDPEADEADQIRGLVAEAKQMIADGWQPPAPDPKTETPPQEPWPGESST